MSHTTQYFGPHAGLCEDTAKRDSHRAPHYTEPFVRGSSGPHPHGGFNHHPPIYVTITTHTHGFHFHFIPPAAAASRETRAAAAERGGPTSRQER